MVWRFHALTAPDSNWGSKKSSPRTEYEQCGRFLLRVLQVGPGRYPTRLPFRFSNLQNCLLNLVEPRGCFSYKFDYNADEGRAEGPPIAAFKVGDPLHLRQVVIGP